jgi:uncharacterized protein YqeY
MLSERIKSRMLEAMKARRTLEKEILRVALGEVQTAESRSGTSLSDEDVAGLLRKLIKSNEESLAATQDEARRRTLEAENRILADLLPRTLTVEEIRDALGEVSSALRAAASAGQATGLAMKHLKAQGAPVQGQDVAAAVRALRG